MNKMLKGRKVSSMDAVMFDIDDTLISTRTGRVIPDVYNLYLNAKNLGYKIVIITARPNIPGVVGFTKWQLGNIGVQYNTLVFADPEGKSLYKRQSKYNFILSVGDQDWDLTDSLYSIKVTSST